MVALPPEVAPVPSGKNVKIFINTPVVMRKFSDKILQLAIKLCMLTGVAFTFAACYGPPPERHRGDDPDAVANQEEVEQLLQTAADEVIVDTLLSL